MAESASGLSLRGVVAGILDALAQAEQLAHAESAQLAENYKKEPSLIGFPVPRFSIADAHVQLRFVMVELPRGAGVGEHDILILTSPEALRAMQPHQVSEMTIHFASSPLRVVEQTAPAAGAGTADRKR